MSYHKDVNQNQNTGNEQNQKKEKPIPVDGFGQVMEMLKIADPAFRESLLKRLAARDKELAYNLRRSLLDAGL